MIQIENNVCYKNVKMEDLDEIIESKLIEYGQPIYLNIYHLSSFNYLIQLLGFGFFHTSLEINGKEFSYSATNDDNSGIFSNSIEDKNLILKEKIYLGNTFYNDEEINEILLLNTPYWLGKSYDPFLKNCNHFTQFLSGLLIENNNFINDYPEYINRITQYSFFFNCFYTPIKRIYGNIFLNPKVENNFNSINTRKNNNIINDIEKNDTPIYHQIETNIGLIVENKIDGEQNYSYDKVSYNNNLEISKDNFSDHLSLKRKYTIKNQKDFINKAIIKYNFFLIPFYYHGNILILKKLSKADYFFINKNYNKALILYQEILKEIENNDNIELNFNKIYSFPTSKYHFNSNDNIKYILLKIKILHSIYYIYFINDLFDEQEIISTSILNFNKNDYFSLFYKSYLKFNEKNIPECVKIIKHGIEICKNMKFKKKFKEFNLIIDQIIGF